MSNENLEKQSLKTDWETISNIMENDQTVLVTDAKGNEYKGKILTSDHRAMFVKVSEDENKVVFHRDIVNFQIVGE